MMLILTQGQMALWSWSSSTHSFVCFRDHGRQLIAALAQLDSLTMIVVSAMYRCASCMLLWLNAHQEASMQFDAPSRPTSKLATTVICTALHATRCHPEAGGLFTSDNFH